MKDFVLDDGFLQSCIDLPEEVLEKMVSRLQSFAQDPRKRDPVVERVDGSKRSLSIAVDDTYRILLRREKSITTLLLVTDDDVRSTAVVSKRQTSLEHMVVAPVEALDTLLVEGKYLVLAKYLLKVPAATRELQFHVSEIEKILNAHLPPEARRFPNWWANQKSGKRAQAFAWMASGWVVSMVDVKTNHVRFTRRAEASG